MNLSAQQGPWRAAARVTLGAESPLYRRLTDPVRSDFIHALPWGQIRVALDVGSEFGAIACDLALYAEKVVALAFEKGQADFVQLRAKQDNLALTPILANRGTLPFAPASFDLITIQHNWWWSAHSEREWILRLCELLRDGGYLCIFASQTSGPAIGMRFAAALSCGAKNVALRRSKRLLAQAGLAVIDVFGVVPSVHEQRLIYNVEDFSVRKYAHARFNPPVSRWGQIRRLFTENRVFYKLCEKQLLILARKDKKRADGHFWKAGAEPVCSVVQLNTSSKLIWIPFAGAEPRGLFESQKAGPAASREGVKHAYRTVQRLQNLHGRDVGTWPMRWPLPLEVKMIGGRQFYGYEFVPGKEVAQLLLPTNFDSELVMSLISRVMRDYLSLTKKIGFVRDQDTGETGWAFWYDLLAHSAIDSQIRAGALVALDRAKRGGCSLGAVHGDLSATNLVLSSTGQLMLLDWEHFDTAFLPAVDLIRFGFDALSDAYLLPRRKRLALVRHVRAELKTLLNQLGFNRDDMEYVRSLYIAHQLIAGAALDDPGRVLARYTAGGDGCPFD